MTEASKEAAELRRLAHALYDLAAKASRPALMGELLNLAGKVVACAEDIEADADPEPPVAGRGPGRRHAR